MDQTWRLHCIFHSIYTYLILNLHPKECFRIRVIEIQIERISQNPSTIFHSILLADHLSNLSNLAFPFRHVLLIPWSFPRGRDTHYFSSPGIDYAIVARQLPSNILIIWDRGTPERRGRRGEVVEVVSSGERWHVWPKGKGRKKMQDRAEWKRKRAFQTALITTFASSGAFTRLWRHSFVAKGKWNKVKKRNGQEKVQERPSGMKSFTCVCTTACEST